jgi:WD40 repeat protein/serine/threonine protein kinase
MSDSAADRDGLLEAQVGRVADEFTERLQRGERPDVEDYARRHPDLAEVLRQVLPALQALAASAPASADGVVVAEPVPGVLGDYRIVREVGRGGMGVVYEAEQISLGRRVALKVLPFAATLDPRQLQRFQTEARAAAGLEHAHVVPVYGVGCERGVHFYVMKFIDGRSLAELIAAQRVQVRPPVRAQPAAAHQLTAPAAALATERAPRDRAAYKRVAEWGVQAALALEHAHGLGVVHRDVKPANLLVDGQGKLWVADFGLARVGADAGLTLTGDVLGTLRYMSPEQALAHRGVVDHRTDLYSLGATLYELLTLEPAVPGKDRAEILRRLAQEEPRPLRQHDRHIPRELETVVLKALAREPAERYSSAQELADDLLRFLEDRPILARRPGALHRVYKWAGRHQAAVAAALTTLVLAVVTLAVSTWLIDRAYREAVWHQKQAEERERELPPHLYPADLTAAHRAWQVGNLKQARDYLARYLPQEGQEELRGFEWYFLWDQCRPLETKVLKGHGGVIYCVAFSPDGTQLASASSDHTIRLWDVLTGRELAVLQGHTGQVNNVAFSPDGKELASWGDDRKAHFWDVAARKETATWPPSPKGGDTIGAGFMADGTRVALVVREGAFDLWDIDAGRKRVFPHGWPGARFWCGAMSRDTNRLALGDTGNRVSVWDLERVWDARRARLLHVFPLPGRPRELACSADGKLVAAVTDGGLVHLLDLPGHAELATLTGHERQLLAVAISHDGRLLASAGFDGTLRVWDVPSRMQRALLQPGGVLWSLALSPDGRLLASGGMDHVVRLLAVPPAAPVERVAAAPSLSELAYFRCGPGGRTLIFSAKSRPGQFLVWDRARAETRVLQVPDLWDPMDVHAVVYSPAGNTLAVATGSGVVLADVATGLPRAGPLTGTIAAFSADSRAVATGTAEGDVLLWDAAGGQLARRLAGPASGVGALAFGPDGKTLASGHLDGKVWLWDTASGSCRELPLAAHRARVAFLTFSPDSGTLFTASDRDDSIHVWDLAASRPRPAITARSNAIANLGLAPDGKTLAVAALTRVTFFHVATGQELFSLEKQSGTSPSINFSADGRALVTGLAEDGEIIAWHAPHPGAGVPH